MIDKFSGYAGLPPNFKLPDFSSMERSLSQRVERFEHFFDSPDAVMAQLARAFGPHEASPSLTTNKPAESHLVPSNAPADNVSEADLKLLAQKSADKYGVNANLVKSVINAESGFNPKAVSKAGAEGLMQLMPDTAASLGVQNRFEPGENIQGGSAYLDTLLTRYHDNLALALAAYNAGPQAVDRYRGVPPYPETRAYVARVIHEFNGRVLARQAAARRAATQRASK